MLKLNRVLPNVVILALLVAGILSTPFTTQNVQAQSGCVDPATGGQCTETPVPPACSSDPASANYCTPVPPPQQPADKPKPTRTSPPPTLAPTFTFTPTATNSPSPTATLTVTPSDTPTATAELATLPPRPTEPSLTPTEAGENPFVRKASTPIPYAWQIFPIDWGGSASGRFLLFGVVGALIIIGILWFRARGFADGSVREKPLLHDQFTDSNGTHNFAKIEKNTPGEANFMKEVFRDNNSFGDSLRNDSSENKQ